MWRRAAICSCGVSKNTLSWKASMVEESKQGVLDQAKGLSKVDERGYSERRIS